jgi:hypothetical protein
MTEESLVLPSVERLSDCELESTADFVVKVEYLEQSTCPSNFDPRDLSRRLSKGYTMKVRRGTNRVVIFKFLLAKLIYAKEGLFIDEYLLLYHLFYELLDNVDPLFVQKHSILLKRVQVIMVKLGGCKTFPVHLKDESKYEIKRYLDKNLISSREYFGLAGQRDIRDSFRLILNDTIVPQAPPPKRFIGVGYKDKGTCRDPAFDGSPGWQFYARHFANLEREAEELDSSNSFPDEFE